MARDYSRIQVLARRVGWLDRNRRMLAITITVMLSPLMLLRMDIFGADWPRVHGALIAAVIGIGTWAITETLLAWLTAAWETECAQLIRENTVPRAIMLKRRRATLLGFR